MMEAQANTAGREELSVEERNWGMLCHLSALGFFVVPGLGHIIGPLVVWLMKRHDYPFVEEQGKESLNFQISMTIYFVISGLLIFAVVGFVLAPLVFITDVVLTIIASYKVSNGEDYRYPLTIRFLK